MCLVKARRAPGLLDFEASGLPISVATWPASADRGVAGDGASGASLKTTKSRGAAGGDRDWT